MVLLLPWFAFLPAWSAAFYGRRALLHRPVLAIDGNGLTVGNPARTVPWQDVRQVRLVEYTRIYGVTRHRLDWEIERGDGTGSDELSVPLEMLSLPWNEIVVAVQDRLGRHVVIGSDDSRSLGWRRT